MNELFEKFTSTFMFFALIFNASIPYFIVLKCRLDSFKKDKIIKNNETISLKIKELYEQLINNENFRKQNENKVLKFLSLNNNNVLIIFTIAYLVTLFFIIFTKMKIEAFIFYVIFNFVFWMIKALIHIIINLKYPYDEELTDVIIPKFLNTFFKGYKCNDEGELKKEDYKFYISKRHTFFNNRTITYNIDSNTVILHDLSINSNGKVKVDEGFETDTSSIVFSGIYGIVELNQKLPITNVMLFPKKHNKNNFNYNIIAEQKEEIFNKLNKDFIDKLNELNKEYKFSFCIEDGNTLYFKVDTYDTFCLTNISEKDFLSNFIKTYRLYTTIEEVINSFITLNK